MEKSDRQSRRTPRPASHRAGITSHRVTTLAVRVDGSAKQHVRLAGGPDYRDPDHTWLKTEHPRIA